MNFLNVSIFLIKSTPSSSSSVLVIFVETLRNYQQMNIQNAQLKADARRDAVGRFVLSSHPAIGDSLSQTMSHYQTIHGVS